MLGHVDDGVSRVGRLDAMVYMETFHQLAEEARFAGGRHGSDGRYELTVTARAGQNGQCRLASQLDAVNVGNKIEGTVETDTVGR